MYKILPVIFALSFTVAPVLAWGEGECSFFKKNKAIEENTMEQVENADTSQK